MTWIDACILGILQGITEFLPISSSGHLIIMEKLLNLPVQALKSFDILVHFGTLLAILCYFGKDILRLFKALYYMIGRIGKEHRSEQVKEDQKTVGYLLIGSIPALFIGFFYSDFLDEYFRSPFSAAVLFIAVGLLFFLVEYIHKKVKTAKITLNTAIVIGFCQAVALIPGVSRSGATISAGLVQGVKRETSARFSFLLGSIAIAAAFASALLHIKKGDIGLPPLEITLIGVAASFFAGFISIAFLMKFLKNHTLNAFAVYRILAGLLILLLFKFS
jgi:undecaprenyl-diphosphatase